MKKVNSLNKYKSFSLNIVTSILSQLLLGQLHAYYNFGFLHNDIQPNNILLSKSQDKLHYTFSDSKITLNVKYVPIITDF